jgi:hypothetical protein
VSTPIEKFNKDVRAIEHFYREPTDAETIEFLERRVAQLERQQQQFAGIYDAQLREIAIEREAKVLLARLLTNQSK